MPSGEPQGTLKVCPSTTSPLAEADQLYIVSLLVYITPILCCSKGLSAKVTTKAHFIMEQPKIIFKGSIWDIIFLL